MRLCMGAFETYARVRARDYVCAHVWARVSFSFCLVSLVDSFALRLVPRPCVSSGGEGAARTLRAE